MNTIKDAVRTRYAELAKSGSSCCKPDCCTGESLEPAPVDYGSLGDRVVPGSNLGLGCGTPTTHAAIQPGETVLDLGSGAGIDAFLAAGDTGPAGRVIGVDMTPEMIAKARANAVSVGADNVEFRLGDIEALPVEADSVDVVLSNCVINLAPDKGQVFSEVRRVLKPGGRLVVSDIVTYGEMPAQVREDLALWAGCVAGAMDRAAYLSLIERSGFEGVTVVAASSYPTREPDRFGIQSVTVEARKPVLVAGPR